MMSRRSMVMLLPGVLAAGPARGLSSTFLQWWAVHREWDAGRWRELFGYLRQLGVDEVVVQWTRYDELDYAPLVEPVLALAEEYRMRVWVGLAQESTWWRDVGGGEGAAMETLRRVAGKCLEQGRALSGMCRGKRAFRGWYLPFELEDENWRSPVAPELMEVVRGLRRELKPLALSGFTNRRLGPEALAKWWKMVARAGLEQVYFQDGIGARKMTLELWPAYLRALDKELGKRLRVVVELFEEGEGGGLKPAPGERVERQVEVARGLARGKLGSFSMPEYLTPLGGEEAARSFEFFLNFHSRHPTPNR